jgi:ionotropic glutamate receptor
MERMNNEYVWIITKGFSIVLDVLKESSIASMQGILGIKSYIPNSIKLFDFGCRRKPRFIVENPHEVNQAKLNTYSY